MPSKKQLKIHIFFRWGSRTAEQTVATVCPLILFFLLLLIFFSLLFFFFFSCAPGYKRSTVFLLFSSYVRQATNGRPSSSSSSSRFLFLAHFNFPFFTDVSGGGGGGGLTTTTTKNASIPHRRLLLFTINFNICWSGQQGPGRFSTEKLSYTPTGAAYAARVSPTSGCWLATAPADAAPHPRLYALRYFSDLQGNTHKTDTTIRIIL